MKKVLKLVAILFSTFLIVGCSKPKITKEQQDNVVTWIVRSYKVEEVEFISFTKNESTGSYTLKMKLNGNDSMITGVLIERGDELDDRNGIVGLSPIDKFESIQKEKGLEEDADVSLSGIKIKYLGEK